MCFFFQAEDGIRDLTVTGVQTCALPIFARAREAEDDRAHLHVEVGIQRVVAEQEVLDVQLRERVDDVLRRGGAEYLGGDLDGQPTDAASVTSVPRGSSSF